MRVIQYGFLTLTDVIDQPITDALIPKINTAITLTLAEHTRQLNALLALFATFTTRFKFRYTSPAAKRLQDLDERGMARMTKGAGFYDVCLPIRAGGDAWGTTYVASQKMTVGTLNDWLQETLTADKRWIRDNLLKALFAKDSYTVVDDEHGTLEILPLANNDAQEYLIKTGNDVGATDNHLLAQMDEVSDAHNPLPSIHRELVEHPENGGQDARVIVLAPSGRSDAIQNLATFTEIRDRDIDPGIANPQLVGALDVQVPGILIGKSNKCWIVEWDVLPDDRLVAVAVGGDAPLGAREHEQESLRGFIEVPGKSGGPYQERQFQRHLGFGALNRVAALIMQFGANNYSVPAGYENPFSLA